MIGWLLTAVSTVTFRIPEWGTVTAIEATWTGIGLIGMAATLFALWRINGDRKALAADEGTDVPKRKASALIWRSHLRREILRLIQMGLIVGVGVWAMTQASLVKPSVITVTGIIITAIFTSVVAITVVQSIQDGRVQREITDLLR